MTGEGKGKPTYVRIGFTGTRQQLSGSQKMWLQQEMTLLDTEIRLQKFAKPALHHGDCVGADLAAHTIALELGWRVIVHPPIDGRYRAYSQGASKTFRPSGYLARDRSIIERCSLLLAVPGTPLMQSDVVRTFGLADRGSDVGSLSGTWYTTLMALAEGKAVRVCGTPPW